MMHGLCTEDRGPFANKIVRASMDFRSDGETTVLSCTQCWYYSIIVSSIDLYKAIMMYLIHDILCSCTHYILVKVPCESITKNIARGCGREPIKHDTQPSGLFARDHARSAIFAVMHERERYFNWFIVAEFLASAALNDSKWALRSKLPIKMLGRSRGKTVEPLRPLTLENKAENKVHFGALMLGGFIQ